MCGIAGIVHTDGRPVDVASLARMATALAHRGPDGSGVWANGSIGFAHRRLAIIDLEGGRQPMVSPYSGCVLTFNGEIYNYRELRRALVSEGCGFRETSDTEVLLRAYERWGEACVDRLHGMFAFAVWDPRRRILLAARDRLGIKPFYFRWHQGTLTFASESKAVLDGDLASQRAVDPESLEQFLRLQYVPAPHTMIAGVDHLPPGSLLSLCVDDARMSQRRYWRPHAAVGPSVGSADLQERLRTAVITHLVADVPVGALLSGGLDSSLVVANMVRATGSPVHTFSVGFDADHLDERAAAAHVASRLGTTHHEQVVTAADAASALPAVVAAMDEPLADYAALPTYLIARFAAQHVKVVLTGEGADELFAGYRRYRRDWLLAPVASWRRPYQASHVFSDREVDALLGRPSTPIAVSGDGLEQFDTLNGLLVRDIEGWLPDDLLVKVDRMTMRCGLEARVPYLDHEFVECALSIPGRRKLHLVTGANKVILREGAAGLVPVEAVTRPKHGFKPPLDAWMRSHLRTVARDALLSPDSHLRGRIDPKQVERLFEGLDRGRPNGHRLWTLLVYELWSRERGVV